MFDALLRFRDPRFERLFWASPVIREWLISIDKLVAILMWLVNAGTLYWVSSLTASGAFSPTVLRWQFYFAAAFVLPNVWILWLIHTQPGWYYKRRDRFVAYNRVIRILGSSVMSALSGKGETEAFVATLTQASLSKPVMLLQVMRAIGVRAFVGVSWIFIAFFPIRLPLNALLHVTMLPAILHGAWSLIPTFSHPQVRPTLCSFGSFLYFLDRGASLAEECNDVAVKVVLYTTAFYLGFVLPLYLAYLIEADKKLRYAQFLGLAPRTAQHFMERHFMFPLKAIVSRVVMAANLMLASLALVVALVNYTHVPDRS